MYKNERLSGGGHLRTPRTAEQILMKFSKETYRIPEKNAGYI